MVMAESSLAGLEKPYLVLKVSGEVTSGSNASFTSMPAIVAHNTEHVCENTGDNNNLLILS